MSSTVVENLELADIVKVPTVDATPVKVSVTFAEAPFADIGKYPNSLERDTTESLCWAVSRNISFASILI